MFRPRTETADAAETATAATCLRSAATRVAAAGITSTNFEHCSYVGSFFPGNLLGPAQGVQVLDVSDPANPALTATLTEPAMLAGTWESLKVNTARKLLVGTGVPLLTGVGLMSVYDISDCAHPKLLNPGPGTDLGMLLPITNHEGGFSPDGNTYWSSGTAPGVVSAVDLTDPANPRVVWQDLIGLSTHGFGISPDGNRMYLSNNLGGIHVLDISEVQRRVPNPRVRQLSQLSWTDGWATQHSIPVTYDGSPYLFTVDEGGSGGVKLIDVSDDDEPSVVNSVKLEINLPGESRRCAGVCCRRIAVRVRISLLFGRSPGRPDGAGMWMDLERDSGLRCSRSLRRPRNCVLQPTCSDRRQSRTRQLATRSRVAHRGTRSQHPGNRAVDRAGPVRPRPSTEFAVGHGRSRRHLDRLVLLPTRMARDHVVGDVRRQRLCCHATRKRCLHTTR